MGVARPGAWAGCQQCLGKLENVCLLGGIWETDWEPETSHLTSPFCRECMLAHEVLTCTSLPPLFLFPSSYGDSITIASLEFDTLLHNAAVGGRKLP